MAERAALLILDGWGERDGEDGPGGRNAVAAADTPTMDRLREEGALGFLETSGRSVGLVEGQMGNSEVGHLNIGAGRIVKQPLARIHDAIDTGDFSENDVLVDAVEAADPVPADDTDADADDGGDRSQLHLMGLVSDGGVHSHQRHLHALIALAADRGREPVVHAFLDGRDTEPRRADDFLAELQDVVDRHGGTIATVSGRYYAMDRDERWDRTRATYDAMVEREAEHRAETALEAVEAAYDRGETDEFVAPTVIDGAPALGDGDSVVFTNFRGDRARQLSRMLNGVEPEWPDGEALALDLRFATMTEYDEDFPFPVAFPPALPEDVLGEVVSDAGRSQLRIAETEKYAHVTYFLNGGREDEFAGEERVIVPSPGVATYDETPAMSAEQVTEEALDRVGDVDVVVLNYANPDMVGHTGDFDAAVAAVEAVDGCTGRLVDALDDAGYHVFVTADHGNAEEMGTEQDPLTAHTLNDVPFVYVQGDGRIGRRGQLRDVAPTLLAALDVPIPDAMTGEPLVEP